MNDALCKPFTDDEISDALFQIGPLKAPGTDGFPARFFQRNWEVLREEVIGAVRNFFDESVMPEGVNNTSIVLIPKKDKPDELKDFNRSACAMWSIKLSPSVWQTELDLFCKRLFHQLKALLSQGD